MTFVPPVVFAWSDVTARALHPALAALPIASQTAIIAAVQRQIQSPLWDTYAFDGAVYLAAHMAALALRAANGAVGPTTDQTIDKVSLSSGAPGEPDPYDATIWGREYKRLRDQIFSAPVTIGGGSVPPGAFGLPSLPSGGWFAR